jgi:hypothetical protein
MGYIYKVNPSIFKEEIMKILIASSALLISLILGGCNSMNNVSQFGNNTVGKGIQFSARTVGTGVGVVSNAGAAVGKGVGTVVGSGVGLVTGQHTR